MSSSRFICSPMLSCQNDRPNCFNATDMWHKPGICPGGLVPLCSTDLSQISLIPALVTLLTFSFLFHFLPFPWSSISRLLPPYHFTLSLFIYFTLSHRWPFVVSQTLCLSFVILFFSICLLISPLSLCLSFSFCVCVSGALLDIFRSLCVVISQRSVQGSVLVSGPQTHQYGAVVRRSALQSLKTWPPKPLVFPKVKAKKKGCRFSLSFALFQIYDVWWHFGDH